MIKHGAQISLMDTELKHLAITLNTLGDFNVVVDKGQNGHSDRTTTAEPHIANRYALFLLTCQLGSALYFSSADHHLPQH